MNDDTLEQFKEDLMKHDWFHYMSDDHSVYLRGEQAYAKLQEACQKDVTIRRLFKEGAHLEDIILVLAKEKDAMLQKIIRLEVITPKRYRKPDGTFFEVYPPKDLIPIIDL